MRIEFRTTECLPGDVAVHIVQGRTGVVIQLAPDLSLSEACEALTAAIQDYADGHWVYVGDCDRGLRAAG